MRVFEKKPNGLILPALCRWLSARRQWLQGLTSWVTAVLFWAFDIWTKGKIDYQNTDIFISKPQVQQITLPVSIVLLVFTRVVLCVGRSVKTVVTEWICFWMICVVLHGVASGDRLSLLHGYILSTSCWRRKLFDAMILPKHYRSTT